MSLDGSPHSCILDTMSDRARGALLGLAVGDALGTTFEFARLEQPAYPILATRPATDVVGGGPFGLVAGQVTDDTQLAVCLARSLASQGRLDPEDVAARYVAWREHAFDVGSQTGASLRRIETGTPVALAGLEVWRTSGCRAAGNGSLMRTAPIGVALRGEALLEAAIADSLITHADPRCALACAVFDAAIAAAIDGGVPSDERGIAGVRNNVERKGASIGKLVVGEHRVDLVAVARAALPPAIECLQRAWADVASAAERAHIATAAADLERDLDHALADAPGVYGHELDLDRTAGFVRVAFRLAFWHAAHTRSWRDALVDVASRGGDADTNAAIVGALLGARDGASAIPEAWRERVLAVTQPGPATWADDHHPRHLLV